jgi:hypothetical protein
MMFSLFLCIPLWVNLRYLHSLSGIPFYSLGLFIITGCRTLHK